MRLSVEHCRAQEALQLARAEEATLDNVRTLALKAAAAWAKEAGDAERAEARREVRVRAEAAATAEFSENPDRALAAEESSTL